MAKGKSQYCTWYCSDCKMAGQVTYYNKQHENVAKEKKRFCPKCRKHTVHKRKDTKKGSS